MLPALVPPRSSSVGRWEKATQLFSIWRSEASLWGRGYRPLGTTLTKGRESIHASSCCTQVVWVLKGTIDPPQKAPAGSRMERNPVAHGSNQGTFALVYPLPSSFLHLPPALRWPHQYTTGTHILLHTLLLGGTQAHLPD